jgi:hypothetical protein
MRARKRYQLLHAGYRQRRVHDQRTRRAHAERDRREIPDRIVRRILAQAYRAKTADRAHQQRIAVGRRLGDIRCADDAAGAGRFSTITVWPQLSVSFAASSRPTTSVLAPGENGAIKRIDFTG